MHSKEKGNHTKEQKDRQCVPWRSRLISPARTHVSAAIWPYARRGKYNNFARDTWPPYTANVSSCLHFGSRDVAAVAGCGSKYLQR